MYIYSNWQRGPEGVGREMLTDIQARMQQVQGVLHTGAFPTRYNGFRLTVRIKSPVLTAQRGFPAGSRVACLKGAIRKAEGRRKPLSFACSPVPSAPSPRACCPAYPTCAGLEAANRRRSPAWDAHGAGLGLGVPRWVPGRGEGAGCPPGSCGMVSARRCSGQSPSFGCEGGGGDGRGIPTAGCSPQAEHELGREGSKRPGLGMRLTGGAPAR